MKPEEYNVGWICALPTEMAAAKSMLDEIYSPVQKHPRDQNEYVLGRIGVHNVVLVCLPAGVTGTVSAATVAIQMLLTFQSLNIKLMVGIGGGAPSNENDIRLGDIVVSLPSGTSGGVIQYDFGKTIQKGKFIPTGSLNKPPKELLSTLSVLRTQHQLEGHKILYHLSEMLTKYPESESRFKCPGVQNDWLYEAVYDHPEGKPTCSQCDPSKLIERKPRSSTLPDIHYGLIASGDRVMRDGSTRERLRRELNVLCFEMEAGGLMDDFPCLVIRGICDYADSHKNKMWQGYAAATAAAYAKEFLLLVQGDRKRDKATKNQQNLSTEETKCLQCLYPGDYESHRKRNPDRVLGTCEWFLQHEKYENWQNEQKSSLLWVSADPGCGKSVLASFLVSKLRDSLPGTISFFFFKDDNDAQGNATLAIRALLHQILKTETALLRHAVKEFQHKGEKINEEFGTLWDILMRVARDPECGDIVCILDGLDECEEWSRILLVNSLLKFYSDHEVQSMRGSSLKFIVTSRPHYTIEMRFRKLPTIRLRVEEEINNTVNDINLFVRARMDDLQNAMSLSNDVRAKLENQLVRGADRTFLWVSLIIQIFDEMADGSESRFQEVCASLPVDLDSLYEKILKQSDDPQRAKIILHLIVAAYRPLTLEELNIALAIAPHHRSMEELRPNLSFAMESTVKRLCGPFVRVIESKIYLVHQTAKEFLTRPEIKLTNDQNPSSELWKYSLQPVQSNRILAERCIWYLLFSDFEIGPLFSDNGDLTESELDSYTRKYEFLDYAAENWTEHVTEAKIQEEPIFLNSYLQMYDTKSSRFMTWFQIYRTIFVPKLHHYRSICRTPTALMAGSYVGDEILVKLLLENDMDVEAKDENDWTPLFWAIDKECKATVELLLKNGANIESRDEDGQTPLSCAVTSRVNEATIKLLLENGANIESKNDLGQTPLFRAAKTRGYEAAIKLLLENGADIESRDDSGRTPLSYIASWGALETIELLLESGADIESRDDRGRTPLSYIASLGALETTELLLENGAEIESRDDRGQTPLSYAASWGGPETIKLLLENGADVESRDDCGQTPLSYAASGGGPKTTELLLENGADIESRDDCGQTPLSYAASWGGLETTELLLENGAEIESRDDRGRTPLSHAVTWPKNEASVKLLLKNGADIESKGLSGETPLSLAREFFDDSAAELLESWLQRRATTIPFQRQGKIVVRALQFYMEEREEGEDQRRRPKMKMKKMKMRARQL